MKSNQVRINAELDAAPVGQQATVASGAPRSSLALADPTTLVAPASPARALQDDLSARLLSDPPDTKWSKRATLIFIVGSCGAFWSLAFWALSALIRR